jgi:hypothetical protein
MNKCTNEQIGQLIGLYEFGALDNPESNAFLDHLIECEYCYDQFFVMQSIAEAFRAHREAAQRGVMTRNLVAVQGALSRAAPPPFWLRKPVLAAASVVVAIGAGLVALYVNRQWLGPALVKEPSAAISISEVAQSPPSPWLDLKIPKPAYVPPSNSRVYRSLTTPFERAMAAYQENNFMDAAEQLEAASQMGLKNAAEVQFYLGVSLLLAGHSSDAIEPLKQAVELNVGERRQSSHYYLALAYLKTNQPGQALVELDVVMKINGNHRIEAEELKQRVIASR